MSRGKFSVSLSEIRWLGFCRHLRTCNLTSTARLGSLSVCLSVWPGQMKRRGCVGSGVSLDDTDNVIAVKAQLLLLRIWIGRSRFVCRHAPGNAIFSVTLSLCSLCSGRLYFFPTANTLVGCGVTSVAAALKLLLRGHTSQTAEGRCMPSTHVHSRSWAECAQRNGSFALQRTFWSFMQLHLYLQRAEIYERQHFRNFQVSRHRCDEVWWHWTALLGVLIPSHRSRLHDSMYMYVQSLLLFSNLCLGRAMLRKWECGETLIEWPQGTVSSPKTVGNLGHQHREFCSHLGHEPFCGLLSEPVKELVCTRVICCVAPQGKLLRPLGRCQWWQRERHAGARTGQPVRLRAVSVEAAAKSAVPDPWLRAWASQMGAAGSRVRVRNVILLALVDASLCSSVLENQVAFLTEMSLKEPHFIET